jgi:two-component system, NarL family, invasion response regulator UvrY
VSFSLAKYLVEPVQGGSNRTNLHEQLSDKEFQILCKFAAGMRVKDISELLSITVSAVYTYKNGIYKKTGLSTIYDLTKYCVSYNLIENARKY